MTRRGGRSLGNDRRHCAIRAHRVGGIANPTTVVISYSGVLPLAERPLASLRRLLGAADTSSHRRAAGTANRLDVVGELVRPVSNRADNDRDGRKVVDPDIHPVVYAWGETAGVGWEQQRTARILSLSSHGLYSQSLRSQYATSG